LQSKTFTLPKESWVVVGIALVTQLVSLWKVLHHPSASVWVTVIAFFSAAYLADLITAFFHFGFDYVWPDNFPIMGPISVEFRQHHDRPMLDPSALCGNLTRGAYMGGIISCIAWFVANLPAGAWNYFWVATTMGIALWGFFFHQIHSYSHMGKTVSPDEFNAAVRRISLLPTSEQKAEFTKLFDKVGIPKWVRILQKSHLFLRPEIHWKHHQAFESDFSSLNGWSDPLTNLFFGPIARKRKAQQFLITQLGQENR
jgi:Lipid desaturase domain